MVGLLLASSACAAPSAMHATLHPSAQGDVDTAGVAVGPIYAEGSQGVVDQSVLQLPYGEGWARLGLGSGQFELRVTPSMGFGSYRINVTDPEQSGLQIAVQPGLGMGYWKIETGSGFGSSSASQLALAPNLTVLFGFMRGAAYVAPRLAYLHVLDLSDNNNGDSLGALAVGGNVGFILASEGFDYSFELGLQRVQQTTDGGDGSIWVLAPSFGMQL